ncbi:hypothetical protein [Clostridium ganghwense]|uniref:Uncharacterized protein n=1 Tax=Clostridium ganghwense TaxID=312089 RepID=A0ABT4CMF0_9CLOT|nr:hypothetical protein [Clostridium ganghwense]MCY6370212.1 hypothetical protein [Clostridium ganghwense]
MNNKVIYVDFKKASRKAKSDTKNREVKIVKHQKSYLEELIDKFKSIFNMSSNKKYMKKADPKYKHWL